MTDQHPRYGERATPEEQRMAAGLPAVADAVPEAPVHPRASSGSSNGRPRPVDRLVTIALLAYGLINVVVTGLSYLDPTRAIDETMKVLGIDGEFTNHAQGKLWGTIAAVALVVGWSLTAWVSIRRLRRGRITLWVPLVGAVVSLLVASTCLAVALLGDPAFVSSLTMMSQG